MATSKTNKKSGDVKSLSKQLSQVSAQAKSLGINNADTRKADSMVRQTDAQGSKKYAGSAFDTEFQANEKVINSMTLKPTGTVKYPEYKDTPVSDFAQNNSGLTGGESNITTDGTNLNVEQPKNEFSALEKIYQDYSTSMTDAQDNMTSAADIQKKLEKETKIKQLRQEEADYASQINTITANRDAAVLSLEGQGRGQTEGFVGGEQARINREAAIKALPVQAQLAAAQNKVQLAQDHITTWGSILMQDATNKYNFKKEQFGALKDYLTDVEKLRLNKLEKENDRKYAEKQSNIQQLTAIMSDAAANGQAGLISQIKTLNPETLTPQQLLNLAGQLRKPVVAKEPKAPTIQNFGTSDSPLYKQYDYTTGTWNAIDGLNNPDVNKVAEKEARADEIATKITNIGNLKTHSGLNSAVGAVGLGRVGIVDAFGAKDEFIGKVEQLISQEFLDKLIDTKGKGATFGALTKPEQDALTAAATAIGFWRVTDDSGKAVGYDIDETSFKEELGTLITLAQKAESQERGYDVMKVPMEDSLFINDLSRSYQSSLMTQDVSNFYK